MPGFHLRVKDQALYAGRTPRAPETRPRPGATNDLLDLVGDYQILDFVVGRLRDDVLLHQLVLGLVGTPGDDLVRVRVADPVERHELMAVRRVETQQLPGRRSGRGCGLGRFGRLG